MQLNPSEISELINSKIQNLDTGAQIFVTFVDVIPLKIALAR